MDAIVAGKGNERHHTVDEMAEVLKQQGVVVANEGVPGKLAVTRLRAMQDKEGTPDIRRDTGFLGSVAKDADAAGLGELAPLVRKVLGGRQMVELGPRFAGTELGRWKDDGVGKGIVLADELVELHILGVAPPLFPLVGIACCDGNVANAGIKLRIQDLVVVA